MYCLKMAFLPDKSSHSVMPLSKRIMTELYIGFVGTGVTHLSV